MKPYPSIPRATGQGFQEIPGAYIFDKLDGRNVRVEWTKKAGWHKWGSRHRLFDATDAEFAPAMPLFEKTYAEPLAKIAKDSRWEGVTAFFELWQPNSLGGSGFRNSPSPLPCSMLRPTRPARWVRRSS